MKTSTQVQRSLDRDPSRGSARRVVHDFWATMERRDLPAIAAAIADDMVWEVMYIGHLLPGGSVYRGKEVITRELLPFVFQAYPGRYEFEVDEMHADGNTVIMEFTVNAETARGRPYDGVKYISVITVENGLIKSAREYVDSLKVKTAHFD